MVGMKPTLPWVLFCGRLVAEKGVGDLLAACDTLARKGKELGVLLLGNGPDAPRLQDLARTLHPLVHVTFVPFVPSDQVPQYMRAADILCLPSHTRANWKEQFGRVLVEAMASSTVVVGSNSGEIPLVIDRHGLVFTEQEPASLAHELGRALDEPGLYERLQASALKHVAAHYTNRVIAANLCDLIWTQVHGGK